MAYVSDYASATESYKAAVLSAEDRSIAKAVLSVVDEAAEEPRRFVFDGFLPGSTMEADSIGTELKVATFEAGRIKLDGTYEFLPEDASNTVGSGTYWGAWSTPVAGTEIMAELPSAGTVNAAGLTFFFDTAGGEYAKKFRIAVYGDNNGAYIDALTITNDSPVKMVQASELAHNLKGVYKVIVTMERPEDWTGTYYFKFSGISFGLTYVLTDDQILSYELVEEGTFYESSLIIPQATIVLDNSDSIFSLFSDNTIATYLKQRMKVKVEIEEGGQTILMSDWRLFEWSVNDGDMTATFVSRPSIGFGQTFTYTTVVSGRRYHLSEAATSMYNALNLWDHLEPIPVSWSNENSESNSYWGEGVSAESAMQALAVSHAEFPPTTYYFWSIGRDDIYKLVDNVKAPWETAHPWMEPDPVRSITNDDLMDYPESHYIFPPSSISGVYQYNQDGTTPTQAEERYDYPNNIGDDIAVYGLKAASPAGARVAMNYVSGYGGGTGWVALNVFLSFSIKGDPLLRPYDFVEVEVGDTTQKIVITKVVHTYGNQILTTQVEGRGQKA